ncbi:MAG: MnhB domain-containing protein [Legionella longbeachae]|nr:MnhB domain-containing protein [Legionella longbeachae]
MTKKKRNLNDYFQLITDNHKEYLKQNTITQLEMRGELENAKAVEQYANEMELYRGKKKYFLDEEIGDPLSSGAKAGYTLLAALGGVGAAAVSYYAQNNIPVINPVPKPVTGIFSVLIGAGLGTVLFNSMTAQNAPTNDFGKLKEVMNKAGFTDEKYNALSKELVALFHFRECVLLGLSDNAGRNMREEFKSDLNMNLIDPQKKMTDKEREKAINEAINHAIEVYFLTELNKFFEKAFESIYKIQEDAFKSDNEQLQIVRWINSFFANKDDREKFTQKLQVEFMNRCAKYLEDQMVEPTFLAKYQKHIASIVGFIGGAIAVGLAVMIIGSPLSLIGIAGIASVGLIIACVTGAATYFSIEKIDSLKYKRDKDNRTAIDRTVQDVRNDSTRLDNLISSVVETTSDDIDDLEKFKNENAPKGFYAYFQSFFVEEKAVLAMGASTSWIREHASRYRHNKISEVDLRKLEKTIIEESEKQTAKMQNHLKNMMTSENPIDMHQELKDFISKTMEYIQNPAYEKIIKNFKLIEKMKQQVLEIIAVVPLNAKQELPKEVINFYTRPVKKGGLGGLEQDLTLARKLAPIVADENKTMLNPHYSILLAAQRLNARLMKDKNRWTIFKGDDDYRDMIHLRPEDPKNRIEKKINSQNIEEYLQNSLDFLYSLNRPLKEEELGKKSDAPIENTHEFILYRTLLIKQLANLVDPKNQRVNKSIREAIKKFVIEKLQLDPKVVFDDVLNQALFMNMEDQGKPIKDNPKNEEILPSTIGYTHYLDYMAEAIRVDLAFVSKNVVTPKLLIEQEAKSFLSKTNKNHLFGYKASDTYLNRPDGNPEYLEFIEEAIKTTDEFLAEIEKRDVLMTSRMVSNYVIDCIEHIKEISSLVEKAKSTSFNPPILSTVQEELNKYMERLKQRKNKYLKTHQKEKEVINNLKEVSKSFKNQQIDEQKIDTMPEKKEIEMTQHEEEENQKTEKDGEEIEIEESNYFKKKPTESELYYGFVIDKPEDLTTGQIIEMKQDLFKDKLDVFIKSLEKYHEKVALEKENYFFINFFTYSKEAKKGDVLRLIDSLKSLKDGNFTGDLSFLDNPIYKNGRLGKKIEKNLKSLKEDGYSNLKELFTGIPENQENISQGMKK